MKPRAFEAGVGGDFQTSQSPARDTKLESIKAKERELVEFIEAAISGNQSSSEAQASLKRIQEELASVGGAELPHPSSDESGRAMRIHTFRMNIDGKRHGFDLLYLTNEQRYNLQPFGPNKDLFEALLSE